MYIATIIPISRGIPFDTLSYYAMDDLAPGTLVMAPFGRQTIPGIVTECTTLAEAKTFVKSAAFSLKKIKTVIGLLPFFKNVTEAIKETSALSLAPLGAVAGNVIPQIFFEYVNSEKVRDLLAPVTEEQTTFIEDVVLGASNERVDYYKRLVRSAFAAKKSVLFVAPTIASLTYWHTQLQKGIPKHIAVIHSKVNKKSLRSAFSLLKQTDYPLIVFTTPAFAVIPRADIGYIIAEDESSNLYKSSDRFGVDLRIFIKSYAAVSGAKLYWGDTVPRFETLARTQKDHLPRTFVPDKLTVVPVEAYRTILPSEVIETIRHAQKKKQRLYIYASRKGVASLSRCSDCGTIVTCPTCELPMVLRNKVASDGTRERSFVCTHCAETLPASHVCSYCASWNITPVSIGTESIRDAIVELVGTENVFTVDDDLTPDSAVVQKMIVEAEKLKFSIIIGTIKVLPFIKNIHYTLFPFFDRQLSTPSLYTTENALRLIMQCNERAQSGVLLFTRHPEFPLLQQFATQKINAIIHDELNLRKDLGYPPYGSLVKVSITVPEGYRLKITEAVTEFFVNVEATQLPARRISAGSMKVLLVWIIKAPLSYIEEEGPDLVRFLESIRYPYIIEENPERL